MPRIAASEWLYPFYVFFGKTKRYLFALLKRQS